MSYVLIHGTKIGTETNNYVRRLQRNTHSFEALRLLRVEAAIQWMKTAPKLPTFERITELLVNPKLADSQRYQYRQGLTY